MSEASGQLSHCKLVLNVVNSWLTNHKRASKYVPQIELAVRSLPGLEGEDHSDDHTCRTNIQLPVTL